ncbi:MAG: hypothetical protein LBJ20_01305 [Candidatus Methanoplasma sp.]|jgi:hypothetical protein|nr:hypothetical protein [Candidatus Methanoplasma sp.]
MSVDSPRKPQDIRKELNELNELLIKHKIFVESYPEDLALKIATDQLLVRRDVLVREFMLAKNAEFKHSYTMTLEGSSILDGEIPSMVLAEVVGSFQETLTSIINRYKYGEKSRGKISKEVKNLSEVRVAATAYGSFKIIFTSGTSTLFPEDESSIHMKAMKTLIDIISQSGNPKTMEIEKQKMGPRTVSKYKKMAELVETNNLSLTLFGNNEELEAISFTKEKAEVALNVINEIEKKPDETIEVEGRLYDIKFDKGKFKMSTIDGKTIDCNKIEMEQTSINGLDNRARYSVAFLVKRSYKKQYDREYIGHIAKSIKVLDSEYYANITDPKNAQLLS